jgi:hypothetical protein
MGIKSYNPGTTEEQRNFILTRAEQDRAGFSTMETGHIESIETGFVYPITNHIERQHFAVTSHTINGEHHMYKYGRHTSERTESWQHIFGTNLPKNMHPYTLGSSKIQ